MAKKGTDMDTMPQLVDRRINLQPTLPQQSTLIAVPTRQLQVHVLQANEQRRRRVYT